MIIDLCRTGHTQLRVKGAGQRDRVVTIRCALEDIVICCNVASFARSDGVLLRNRHDIVAE